MGNSPSQGGIEELERAESRIRDGSGTQRNSHRSQLRNEGANDGKTNENLGFENFSQAQGVSPMQVVNRIKANSREASTSGKNKACYNDPLNYRQSCSPPTDSFAEMQNIKPENKTQTPFSELRSEFFNASEPVPWADSLIISNPLRVEGCSILSADSLEQIQNLKSDDDEVFFADSVQNLQLSKKIVPSETPTFSEATSSQCSDILLLDESIVGGCAHDANANEPVNKMEVQLSSAFNLLKESEPIKIHTVTLHDRIDLRSDEFSTLKETPIIDTVVELELESDLQDVNATVTAELTEINQVEKTENINPIVEKYDLNVVDALLIVDNLVSIQHENDCDEKINSNNEDESENKNDSYPTNVNEPDNKIQVQLSSIFNLEEESEQIKIQTQNLSLQDLIDLRSEEFPALKEIPIIDNAVELVSNLQDINVTAELTTEVNEFENMENLIPRQEKDDLVDALIIVEDVVPTPHGIVHDEKNCNSAEPENNSDLYPTEILLQQTSDLNNQNMTEIPVEQSQPSTDVNKQNLTLEKGGDTVQVDNTPLKDKPDQPENPEPPQQLPVKLISLLHNTINEIPPVAEMNSNNGDTEAEQCDIENMPLNENNDEQFEVAVACQISHENSDEPVDQIEAQLSSVRDFIKEIEPIQPQTQIVTLPNSIDLKSNEISTLEETRIIDDVIELVSNLQGINATATDELTNEINQLEKTENKKPMEVNDDLSLGGALFNVENVVSVPQSNDNDDHDEKTNVTDAESEYKNDSYPQVFNTSIITQDKDRATIQDSDSIFIKPLEEKNSPVNFHIEFTEPSLKSQVLLSTEAPLREYEDDNKANEDKLDFTSDERIKTEEKVDQCENIQNSDKHFSSNETVVAFDIKDLHETSTNVVVDTNSETQDTNNQCTLLSIPDEEPKTPSATAQGVMPKSKSTVSKTPINKRVSFSRKLVKNNFKNNDAFDCIEIFAPPSPKQLPLTEIPVEQSEPSSDVNKQNLTLEKGGDTAQVDNTPLKDKTDQPENPEPPQQLPVKLMPVLPDTLIEIPVVPEMNSNNGETEVEECGIKNTSLNENNNDQSHVVVTCKISHEKIEENIPPSCTILCSSSNTATATPSISEIPSTKPTASTNINSASAIKTDLSENRKTSSSEEVRRESPNTGAAKIVEVSKPAKTSMANLSSHQQQQVVNNATMPNNVSKPSFPYKVSIPQDEFKLNQHSENAKCGMPSPSKGPTLCSKPPTTSSHVPKHSNASPAQGGSSWISGRSQQFQKQPEEESTPEKSSANKTAAASPNSKKLLEHLAANKYRDSQSTQDCVDYIGNSRNCIMSPSLSNNIYIDMNGIDAEALNALAAQEEQYLEQLQEKENLINELQQNLEQAKHKTEDGENFSRVLAEYEKTLALYVQQIDDLKLQIERADEEKLAIMKDRDQAIEDLRNVESAFSDVHRKYERAKALLENLKKNEEILVRRDQDMMIKVENRERKLDTMREKVQENMEKMHQDYETKLREAEADNARLRAQFRKMEMKLSTLENDVEQKAKENAQLSALCDELINGEVIN